MPPDSWAFVAPSEPVRRGAYRDFRTPSRRSHPHPQLRRKGRRVETTRDTLPSNSSRIEFTYGVGPPGWILRRELWDRTPSARQSSRQSCRLLKPARSSGLVASDRSFAHRDTYYGQGKRGSRPGYRRDPGSSPFVCRVHFDSFYEDY